MTREQWEQHQQWLSRNALPKPLKSPKMKLRKRLPLAELLDRILSLSAPRWERQKFTGPAKLRPVKPSALKATASDRLMALCIPKERHRRAKGPIIESTALSENVLKAEG